MFAELTQEDIIESINSETQNPFRQGIDYSVFFNGRMYSPREIITRHYALNGLSNPNPGFNTNNAQEALLKLGFPIVANDFTASSDFFTQKDLQSFDAIVGRRKYDATNPVDHSIAKYLNQIPWGKTKFWANLLASDKWDIEGSKTWNTTNRILKQVYKQYTWFRLIPKGTTNRRVYFTVGIDWYGHRQLIFKMDIQREDPYFNPERTRFFDDSLKTLGIPINKITHNALPTYDWDRLIDESKTFMETNLDNYYKIVKELEELKPIKAARICWNNLGWTEPSGRDGKSLSDSFESTTGFANDEWLFDLDSTLDGYCYARLEPIHKSRKKLKGKQIDLMLFTQRQGAGNMHWVGKINNVSIVGGDESSRVYRSPEGTVWQVKRFEQLEKIENVLSKDYLSMPENDFYNIKFRPEDVEVFEDNLLVADGLFKLQRYILYDFDRAGEKLARTQPAGDGFEPSDDGLPTPLPSPPKKIKKTFTAGTIEYDNTHKEIQNALINYLSRNYPQAKITSENSREINNRMIDVVMKQDGRKVYFEVKSYPSLRASIRVALGQLIEYCFFSDANRATELVIVSHIRTTDNVEKFMSHLRKTLALNIHYHQFDLKANELKDWKF
ncbi:hypothetical protein [Flavobacterium sp.]|uniref:hypothetical protein n=1 Tax=Flavobacterium sp. TaxID=239 RepID=UPI0026066C37|nr:hypothetical protein [Flavobacterium sp.]